MRIKVDRHGSLPLSQAKVFIWIIDTNIELSVERLTTLQSILSFDERNQLAHFQNALARHQYLLTRALVRTMLSRYTGIAAPELQFGSNLYGKPTLKNRDSVVSQISFNVTHTTGLIALVITGQRKVGIDAEHPLRSIDLDVSDYYFSYSERDAMKRLPIPLQQERFLALWTLKESYIKARGMGLAIPLDKFGFRWNDHLQGPEGIEFSEEFDDDPSCWQFWYWRCPTEKHHLSLCVAARPGDAPTIVVNQTDPMFVEKELGRYSMKAA
jgi:4'-phosphopantetheinyl transferase